MKSNQNGFSLIELLVVVIFVGILSTLAVIGYNAVVTGTRDSVQTTRLMQYVDAQNKFKTVKGKRRFGTMQELYAEGLLNESVIKYDDDGNQVAQNNWVMEPGDESTAYLREHFFVVLYKDSDKKKDQKTYCIGDDGVLRSVVADKYSQCTITSPRDEK